MKRSAKNRRRQSRKKRQQSRKKNYENTRDAKKRDAELRPFTAFVDSTPDEQFKESQDEDLLVTCVMLSRGADTMSILAERIIEAGQSIRGGCPNVLRYKWSARGKRSQKRTRRRRMAEAFLTAANQLGEDLNVAFGITSTIKGVFRQQLEQRFKEHETLGPLLATMGTPENKTLNIIYRQEDVPPGFKLPEGKFTKGMLTSALWLDLAIGRFYNEHLQMHKEMGEVAPHWRILADNLPGDPNQIALAMVQSTLYRRFGPRLTLSWKRSEAPEQWADNLVDNFVGWAHAAANKHDEELSDLFDEFIKRHDAWFSTMRHEERFPSQAMDGPSSEAGAASSTYRS